VLRRMGRAEWPELRAEGSARTALGSGGLLGAGPAAHARKPAQKRPSLLLPASNSELLLSEPDPNSQTQNNPTDRRKRRFGRQTG